jgi:hypothetical protein
MTPSPTNATFAIVSSKDDIEPLAALMARPMRARQQCCARLTLPLAGLSRVKTHYLRGRDAGHFGRWLGARSDVIYTIMSDEQQRQRPKGPRPFRLQRKSPPGSSKSSTVCPIRSSLFSCPASDFGCNAARGNNEF